MKTKKPMKTKKLTKPQEQLSLLAQLLNDTQEAGWSIEETYSLYAKVAKAETAKEEFELIWEAQKKINAM
jgi:hypothetical protein